ncbi:MAG: hypothetical protein ACREJN_21390 [Nitrospiraceae bacterium]
MAGPGILSSILDTTGKRVDQRIAQSNEMDKAMRDLQTKALLQSIYATDETTGKPKLSQQEAEEAWSRIEKMNGHNKGAKEIVAKAKDITSKLLGHIPGMPGGNPAMAARAQDQTASALSGGDGGQLVAPPANPSTPGPDADPNATATYSGLTPPPPRTVGGELAESAEAPPAAGPTPPPQRTSTVDLMRAGAPMNANKLEIDKENRGNEEWTRREGVTQADKIATIQATAAAHGDKKVGQFTGDDGKLHLVFQALDGSVYEQDSKGTVRPYVSRLSPGSHLSVSNAQSLASSLGQQFLDEAGNPLDVTKLNIQEELIPITGGTPNRYKVATQSQKTITTNNVVNAVPTLEQTNPTAQVPLGAARVGTESTQETPMIDASGNTVAVPMRSTSAPVATPASGTSGLPAPPQSAAPRVLPNTLPQAEFNNQQQIARPVRAAAVQLFGNPDNPDQESLETFAHLADDPKSRARIGTAARLVINDLAAADKSGGVGASLLGTGVSASGGLWGALKNWSGLTAAVGEQQAAATDRAVQALTPEEARALNQIMAAYGTVVGLRSLTRGGAYKFSTDSMERELPIPGISDVSSSTTYYNKLAKIANEVVEGTKGVSDAVLPEKAQYIEAARRLNLLGQGKNPNAGLTPPPSRSSAAAVDNANAPAGYPFSVTVNGKPYYFDTQANLDRFKKAANIP